MKWLVYGLNTGRTEKNGNDNGHLLADIKLQHILNTQQCSVAMKPHVGKATFIREGPSG